MTVFVDASFRTILVTDGVRLFASSSTSRTVTPVLRSYVATAPLSTVRSAAVITGGVLSFTVNWKLLVVVVPALSVASTSTV
ncbi:hypothetical protein [Streptococcus suis]|uniref:hypothetical protein n=1 Tax=Streptococcus suis TaxID=1307 RepID=UPI000F4E8FB0|nr:hypothetical protein [Streptococcus suis]MBY5025573.1 hypothetical protein [Streptococcus suis]MBY5032026.1 hypothetical protein [Streptococcus suis]MBY5036528.1 hypothetical protein [Streptococcus suis]MCQ8262873.1 hypothetical protein [Streptococcus suis]NQJ20434.1 hypothetical protein [Streptococcus suis]